MDSFAEPHRRTEYSLEDVRAQVRKLEDDHRSKGIPLSGRIIHVCHYLPFTCSLSSKPVNGVNGSSNPGIPSPPQTPPAKPADIPPSPVDTVAPAPPTDSEKSKWQLNSRYGHSAMVSGITSLSATHEQVFVGWTGDVLTPASASAPTESGFTKVGANSITKEDKDDLEHLLASGKHILKDELSDGKSITYVPVWLDDKEAHGHYDGYCKQSEFPRFFAVLLVVCTIYIYTFMSTTFHFHPTHLNLCMIVLLHFPSSAVNRYLISLPTSPYLLPLYLIHPRMVSLISGCMVAFACCSAFSLILRSEDAASDN